jgi:hypothetical protein
VTTATGTGTGTITTTSTTATTLDRMANLYAWLSDIKADLDITATATTYDAHLLRELERASRMVDGLTGWRFYPELATRYFDVDDDDHEFIDGATIYLPEPLLSVTTLSMSDDDGAAYDYTLTTADYYLSYGGNYNATPYSQITLAENGTYTSWCKGQRALRLAGVWGYRRQYASGWEDSKDTVAVAMNASQTTVTVADADGTSQMGTINRFQIGQLIRADSEYMVVIGRNTSTNVLTLIRGANGTTAATHAGATRIDVWRPEPLAANCARVQAVRWFKRAQAAFQDVTAAIELGQLTYAQELDPDIRSMLKAGLMRLV